MFKWLSSEKNLKLALKILGLSVACLAMLSYFGYVAITQKDPQPCEATELPRRCYQVSQDACQILWKHVDADCKTFVSNLNSAPSRLTGPILAKCRFAQFDKANTYVRSSKDGCEEFFEEVRGWRARNMDIR